MDNKTKITLISPYDTITSSSLRPISSYLKQNGHSVELIFLPMGESFSPHFYENLYQEETIEDLISICKDSDLIGFSLMTCYFLKVKDMTLKIKKQLDIPIIWGGIHATVSPEECIEIADMVCLGEGEETMLELANRLKSGNIDDIQSLWLNKNGKIIKNEIRPLEENLDKYPFQDFDIDTHFILNKDRIVRMTEPLLKKSLTVVDEEGEDRLSYELITVRNCPHNCTYCCNNALRESYRNKGRFVRKRSVENVIEELEQIKKKFDFIKHITILDDTFFIRSREEIGRFSRLYKNKIGLPLNCNMSPKTLDEPKLKLMIDAGMVRSSIGIQSLDDDILIDIYKRDVPREMVMESVRLLNKYSSKIPRPIYHLIVDNPYETKESVIANIEFVASLPLKSRVYLFPLIFYPGTELSRRAKKDGLIKDEIKEIYTKPWTIDGVVRLDYLTCILYFTVWSKLSKPLDRLMKRAIKFLTKKQTIRLCDNRFCVFLLKNSFKLMVQGVKFVRKVKHK